MTLKRIKMMHDSWDNDLGQLHLILALLIKLNLLVKILP